MQVVRSSRSSRVPTKTVNTNVPANMVIASAMPPTPTDTNSCIVM